MASEERHGDTVSTPAAGSGDMDCKEMMAKPVQMMADMKAIDTELDHKVAAMNEATGGSRVEAMAAVINELVSQRKAMQAKMIAMHSGMTDHMGGATSPQQDSMSECPMMKGVGGSSSK
jgi:hypothetical protein